MRSMAPWTTGIVMAQTDMSSISSKRAFLAVSYWAAEIELCLRRRERAEVISGGQMRLTAASLVGRHDFSAFRGAGCSAKTPVRTIKSAAIKKNGDFIEIIVEADAFLQYMMRNIAGTLVETGLGRFSVKDVERILSSCDRTKAGRTAPPQGLYLIKVFYSMDLKT